MSRYARRQTILFAALSLWLCVWSGFAWHAVQDDAFIHLRYADHLLRFHRITYDGVHSDFGASSLLYVGILAALRVFTTSPDLPHIVSLLQHVALFAALVVIFNRLIPKTALAARALALLTIILVITPSAVRWFQDGMETGLTTLLCVLLVAAVWRFSQLETLRPIHYAILFALGFVMILHRIELGLAVALACGLLALGRRNILAATPLFAGAALSVAGVIATMHALLPDTAIAKSQHHSKWFAALKNSVIVLTGGMSIGAGLAALWIISLILLLRTRRLTLTTAIANSVFPITIFLVGMRGQEIQGARYLIWMFLFSITWNILELGASSTPARLDGAAKILIVAFVIVLVVDIPVESYFMHSILIRRAETLHQFEASHLQQIEDLHGVAYDIGYIGYFTGAPFCDMAALVNGRDAAHLSQRARSIRCSTFHNDFFFGDLDDVEYFSHDTSLHGWRVCGSYDFVNTRASSRHFLLASPAVASRVCAAGNSDTENLPPRLAFFIASTAPPPSLR